MESPIFESLSDRELDVLELLATGASNKEIATELSISMNTVKVHLRNIYAKTGTSSRTEAAMQAVRQGLLSPADVMTARPTGQEAAESLGPPGLWDRIFRIRWLLAGLLGLSILVTMLLLYGSLRASPEQTLNGGSSLSATEPPRWQQMAVLPTPRRGLAVVAFDSQIFAIAGEGAAGVTGLVDRYDPATDQWTSRSPKPVPVADVSAVVIGGRVFMPGGRLAGGQVIDRLEIYDPLQDVWETGESMPAARSAYALAAFEGRLYVFGGWDGAAFVNTVYMYTPDRDEWQSIEPLPEAAGFAVAATAGGSIYVLGGETESGPAATNLQFRPDRVGSGTEVYLDRAPIPEARYAMGVASIADIIHIIGGEGSEPVLPGLKYFPERNEWEAFDLPEAVGWSYLGAAAIGSDFYALGGVSGEALVGRNLIYKAVYTVAIPIFNR